ncbi:MAG: polymer-forming cytoskeletal protein [Mariniphaga sp.]
MAKPTFNEVKALNSIAQDTKITGNIESEGDFRLDGALDGILNCTGRVVLGPEARLKGEIHSNTAEISGTVEGEITVTDLLSLKATAVISGDLIMGRFSVEPGARFSGICKMNAGDKSFSDIEFSGLKREIN